MGAMNLKEIRSRAVAGEAFTFRFFWGHRGPAESDACLSQWFPCIFTVDRHRYECAEQFMMAEKARLFGDDDALRKILRTGDPSTAKKLGRKVRGFDDSKWHAARFDIVVRGNIAKFGQSTKLKEFLLSTGDDVLVEASPRDRIWGIGMSSSDAKVRDPRNWRGLNLLGFALMEARTQLR